MGRTQRFALVIPELGQTDGVAVKLTQRRFALPILIALCDRAITEDRYPA